MRSAWGDFGAADDRAPFRVPAEGPRGWRIGIGVLLFLVGLAAIVVGQTTYMDWNGPDDRRASQHLAFSTVPGLVVLVAGIAVFVWGWWRNTRID